MPLSRPPSLLLFALIITAAPGCFPIFVEDGGHGAPAVDPNHDPQIDADGSWWRCDRDADFGYFFEFETLVDDFDGLADVLDVGVTIRLADDPGSELGFWALNHEGAGVWGGLVWESESVLYCGEPIDVLIEAWDHEDAYDSLLIRYR